MSTNKITEASLTLSTEVERPSGVIPLPPSTNDPFALMISAAGTMSIENLRALMEMKKELMADQARQAFNKAFAAFKAEAVTVTKGTLIKDGPLKGKRHANLHDVVVATAEALGKHGLSTAWKLTKDEPAWMEVTCILRHDGGHSESVSMAGAPDTGPGRNAIQARGSAKTYLERYTLTAILGLAATDQDDDGQGGRGKPFQKEGLGAVHEPRIESERKPEPESETRWQDIYPEEWTEWEFRKVRVSEMDAEAFWLAWKSNITDPALAARGAEWIENQIEHTEGLSWSVTVSDVPGTPPDFMECNPANLWAVARYLRQKGGK